MAKPPAVLVGPLTVDRYLDEALDLPGGGALNMAYHWATAGRPTALLGRFGDADAAVFETFAARYAITLGEASAIPGPSSSIDIEIRPDGQPWMDNFVEGANASLRLTDAELAATEAGVPTHVVLVDVVDAEVHRWAAEGRLEQARLSGDFLDFRHMSTERFRATAAQFDVAFVGWPGDRDDTQVAELRQAAGELGVLLVVTFGADGVLAVDGRAGSEQWFDVEAVEVTGTTVGCGDAFIAAFLDHWYDTGDLDRSVDAGRVAGAAATAWRRPLPESAYR